ncbi:restriction modification system DNA specificity domain-containing protein [Escherichia coli]|uniref:restriction endonuclease subunit S n=1 Tax=Escherichia coli TaxID=562 RepID=UPI000BE13D8C|nr:restriction endonuclease subunit S [Escherichia coli]EEU9580839.1 restriction endonuclease subunit S [Escherichia coli]EJN3730866.1 restriction endonuclease subunit S [Escherichia coli]EJN3835535.1 restriction endonuclease subunit S [Escherichia coli]EJN4487450.1 restriction endonuclease subunit S [Escherichia coli]CAD5622044.1 restriction modification system DNA specificity domain-containing protein [Escherichia coli]
MGSKWETVRLGDLTKWSSGGTPNKSEDSYWNGTIPWISASSMEGHLYSDSKLKITEDGLINGSRLAPANSILLLVRGSILHQKIQVGLATKAVAFNQDVKCLIVNNDMIDPWYLLLWFKAKEQDLLKIVESTGIGAGKLDTKLLMDYPVEIPPKEIKEYIRFLGKAIFDKITLNENINYNLEKMSQTLFKSWFVDFDPVIDNALDAGNPIPEALQSRAELRQKVRNCADFKPLPAEIRSLFPSEFEETELGWVPKGWHYKNAEEIATISIGKTPPRTQKECFCDKKDSNYAWVSIKDLGNCSVFIKDSSEYLTSDAVNSYNVKIVPKDAVLLSFKLTIGRIAIAEDILTTNEAIAHFYNMKHGINKEYLYSYLKIFDYNSLGSTSSIATAINSKIIRKIPVLVPDGDILEKYKKTIDIIFQKIKFNNGNICNLTALRDTLLPKLISGELSLEDLPDLNTDTEAA